MVRAGIGLKGGKRVSGENSCFCEEEMWGKACSVFFYIKPPFVAFSRELQPTLELLQRLPGAGSCLFSLHY